MDPGLAITTGLLQADASFAAAAATLSACDTAIASKPLKAAPAGKFEVRLE